MKASEKERDQRWVEVNEVTTKMWSHSSDDFRRTLKSHLGKPNEILSTPNELLDKPKEVLVNCNELELGALKERLCCLVC